MFTTLKDNLDEARCARSPFPDLWFAQEGSPAARAAQAICESCPLVAACKETAVRTREPYGIWGGRTTAGSRARPADAEDTGMRGNCLRGHDLSVSGRWSATTGRRRCVECERQRNLTRRVRAMAMADTSTGTTVTEVQEQEREAC